MFKGFRLDRVNVGEVVLRVRYGGAGAPVVLLHGHPRTHTTWHEVAPRLAAPRMRPTMRRWRPVPAVVWRVEAQAWSGLLWTVYALGWWTGTYQSPPFRDRWLYAWIRHPMMLGLLVAFWATPRMSVGHLFFAAAGTGYIAVGLHFEERDLRRQLGDVYREYADRVPALIPSPADLAERSGARGRRTGPGGRPRRGAPDSSPRG